MDIFSLLDTEHVVYYDNKFMIVCRQSRGYEEVYTLHEVRNFCGYSWWSNCICLGDIMKELFPYIERCNNFDKRFKV